MVLRALFFCLLLSLPTLLGYYSSNGYSPWLFSDWDEPLYLVQSLESCRIPLSQAFSFGDRLLAGHVPLSGSVPHEFTDLIIGHIACRFGLSALALGIALDLLCAFVCYLLLSRALRPLVTGPIQAEIGAVTILCLPWIASLVQAIPLPFSVSPNLITESHEFHVCLPILRAIYTQVSYLPFSACLALIVACLFDTRVRYVNLGALGFIIGSLLYVYFFAWGSALTLAAWVFTIDFLSKPTLSALRTFTVRSVLVFGFAGLISIPGLLVLFPDSSLISPGNPHEGLSIQAVLRFRDAWFLSPFMLILGALLAFGSPHLLNYKYINRDADSQAHQRVSILITLALACIASELCLTNLQPLLNRWMTPYHFSLYYIHPLLSGCLVLIIISTLRASIRRAAQFGLILVVIGMVTVLALRQLGVEHWKEPYLRLIQDIQVRTNPHDTVRVIPFAEPLDPDSRSLTYLILPYWIRALTGRDSRPLLQSYSVDRKPYLLEELATAWYFTGRPQLLAFCPTAPEASWSRDIIGSAVPFLEAQRYLDCQLFNEMKPELSACDILTAYPTSYLIWDSADLRASPSWDPSIMQPIWQTSDGKFHLIKFDANKARSMFCSASQSGAEGLESLQPKAHHLPLGSMHNGSHRSLKVNSQQ